MSLNVKYHYTHFIYPFTVKSDMYYSFIKKMLKDDKNWKFHIDRKEANYDSYKFFLPYMKKFLFPTLFWNNEDIRNFKKKSFVKKVVELEKLSCVTFNYNLDTMKIGSVSKSRYGVIDFDIVNIRLITFPSGICFIDFKTEIYGDENNIDFEKILDFNNIFRDITNSTEETNVRAKCVNCMDDIATFISKITDGYVSKDIERKYYDKLFTYSYACIDKKDWNSKDDYDKILNDFYRFQYVEESANKSLFNKDCEKLKSNLYTRWENSIFGFSRESGVVMSTEADQYSFTALPESFENKYLYILILALYQRVSLINFSYELIKNDKTQIGNLKRKFTSFTHFSWFSQISNSEHGMQLWKMWKKAFELEELFEEVHKEYLEYYEYLSDIRQERINFICVLIFIITAVFSGAALLGNIIDITSVFTPIVMAVLLTVVIISYPLFLVITWFKHKAERK